MAAASSAAAAEVRVALTGLRDSIATLAKQHALARTPLLVAVSKTKPIEAIQHAYNAPVVPSQRHFGENYVQELLEKAASPLLNQDPASPEHVRWHFIGHLQTNKCKAIARIPNLALVESVDSVKLATELNKACLSVGRASRLPVLIQVNTSAEESKYGCAPADAVSLYGHVLANCPQLQARGLMTIGRLADTPQPDCFDLLVAIREQIFSAFNSATSSAPSTAVVAASAGAAASSADSALVAAASSSSPLVVDPATFELSMGMSGDYELAAARGATILRIGSTIFGSRQYPAKEASATAALDTAASATPAAGQR